MMSTPLLSMLMPHRVDEPRFYGVAVGIVTNNQDPEGLGRIKVKVPWLSDEYDSDWARIATPMAGAGRGMYFLPEVEDEVLVAFEHGLIDRPFVVGALWNGKDAPPEANGDGENNVRTVKSRSGHVIRFNDTEGGERIEIVDSTANNSVVIDSAENKIVISADSNITIQSHNGKLILSGNGVEITSQDALKIEAGGALDIQGGAEMNLNADMINLN
ncbi:MAG: phage baseplate assembly protein V [Anaerolineae bacterium]|nr:phage baseplate assembly protein V [Anaerolineae bacterium]